MTIASFLSKVDKYILNPLVILMFAVAVLYFVYGIVKFLSAGVENVDKSRAEAQNAILWGIVGMIVMFSVYGLIQFVMDSFGVSKSTQINGTTVEPVKYIESKL